MNTTRIGVRSFEEFCYHKVMEYCDAYELSKDEYQIEVVKSGVNELVDPYCYLRFESERKNAFFVFRSFREMGNTKTTMDVYRLYEQSKIFII